MALKVTVASPLSTNGPGLAPMVTSLKPMKVCPSPNPVWLAAVLVKNSIRYVAPPPLLFRLLSVPVTVVLPPLEVNDVRTG